MGMRHELKNDKLDAAVNRVSETADQIRDMAAEILNPSGSLDRTDSEAVSTAYALARISKSLERLAEGAMTSGLTLRDQSRDAARAISRGERTLRRDGFVGVGARAAVFARRHAGMIVLLGGGMASFLLLRRQLRSDE